MAESSLHISLWGEVLKQLYTYLGIFEKLLGFKFYHPNSRGIFETRNAHFFEDIKFLGEIKLETLTLRKNTMIVLIQKII